MQTTTETCASRKAGRLLEEYLCFVFNLFVFARNLGGPRSAHNIVTGDIQKSAKADNVGERQFQYRNSDW